MKYSSSHHPQTDGQTKVVNRSLCALLWSLLKKNLREWESLLPHAEFAFNKSTNRTTGKSPFEVVYGKNPLGPLDLSPLLQSHSFSGDANDQVKQLKSLYETVSRDMEKQIISYKEKADKKMKKQLFEIRDLVWVYLRKERFPNQQFPKLQDRVDGPLRVIQKMGDNAY